MARPNEEVGQTNTTKEENPAATSTENAIRNSSQAVCVYYQLLGKRDLGRPKRKRVGV
jgi:hypothetical protein